MKTKQLLVLTILGMCFLAALPGHASDITATGSGNWSSTIPDAPWPGGTVPNTNDSVDIESPYVVTVDSTAQCAYLYGGGTVTLAENSTLDVYGDPMGAYGTQTFGQLNATANGCTVNYRGNVFWAKRTDYFNLTFSGYGDFYTGVIPGYGATAITVGGNFNITGTNVAVQQGADITINGNFNLAGVSNKWDCSVANFTVGGNSFVTGTKDLLVDLDGADGYNSLHGNMTVGASALAWNVSDVVTWELDGSLSNLGLIAGKGYGSIMFAGSGSITGKPLKLPTISVNGTYLIGTPITLTTNTPTLTGTLIFDIVSTTNRITLQSYPTNQLTFYYGGSLVVTNSGSTPAAGSTFTFFAATNYNGSFLETTFPTTTAGYGWVDNTLVNGSITLMQSTGSGSPTLSISQSGSQITLMWDAVTYPGYTLQAQTNSGGFGTNWARIPSGMSSPFVYGFNPTNKSVFFRLVKP